MKMVEIEQKKVLQKKQFLCFRSFLQLWRKLFTPKTIIPLFPVIRWILAESVNRTLTVDGMSSRRCLSGGGDIFSKSVERQGGANRTFKASGCCHGWQLEPCPYGLEPLLTFRKKIPTGRPHIEEGHSVRRRRSWGLRQPYVTRHASIHKCVAKGAPHLFH